METKNAKQPANFFVSPTLPPPPPPLTTCNPESSRCYQWKSLRSIFGDTKVSFWIALRHFVYMSCSVMPDCRGVGESRIYSKRAKKSPFAGFVPQSGITGRALSCTIRCQSVLRGNATHPFKTSFFCLKSLIYNLENILLYRAGIAD